MCPTQSCLLISQFQRGLLSTAEDQNLWHHLIGTWCNSQLNQLVSKQFQKCFKFHATSWYRIILCFAFQCLILVLTYYRSHSLHWYVIPLQPCSIYRHTEEICWNTFCLLFLHLQYLHCKLQFFLPQFLKLLQINKSQLSNYCIRGEKSRDHTENIFSLSPLSKV